MTNLIALLGPKGCGKTTLAKQLSNHGWKTTSFATPVKNMLWTLLANQNIDLSTVEQMIYGDLKETPTPFLNNKSPRYAMQTLGTEWRDLIDKNLWVDIWERSIDLNREKIIVDDMRFSHEENKIKSLDGKIIQIVRSKPLSSSQDEHISEQEYLKIRPDYIIYNNSTPENMLSQLNQHLNGEIS